MDNSVNSVGDDVLGGARIDRALAVAMGSSVRFCARVAKELGWPVRSRPGFVTLNQSHGSGLNSGETDVLVSLPGIGVMLFESKFNAAFQPLQGERYAQRAGELRRSGSQRSAAVLCATEGYLSANAGDPEAKAFDHRFPVERLVEWLESFDDPGAEEALALRLLTQVASDWHAGAFQGVKGWWIPAYTALSRRFGNDDTGWYVKGNHGDWIHIHHEACSVAKFHYRNPRREVSLELRRRGTSLAPAAVADVQRRGWRISGKHQTVVIRSVSVGQLGPDDPLVDSDVAAIVAALDGLKSWWAGWSRGAM